MKRKIILVLIMFAALLIHPIFGANGVKIKVSSKFENLELLKPVKIIVHNNQIYLLDRGHHAVRGYTEEGKLLVSVGQKGQGPGEFMTEVDFQVHEQKIFVLDSSAGKIEIFSLPDGKHLKSIKIPFTNASKLLINGKGKYYLAALKIVKGQKLISEFLIDKEKIQIVNSFLDCVPIKGDFTEIYKNFGSLTSSKDRIYFAYIIKNEILEFSLAGEHLKTHNIPLQSLDLKKMFKDSQSHNLVLKKALNYDIKAKNNGEIYLLSRDHHHPKKISILYRLEKGEFKEIYTMDEKLISFDLSATHLWAIDNEEMEVINYKLPVK